MSSLSRAHLEATSILTLGATGTLDGQPFTLVGRRCFQGRRGNLWNEWTLSNVPHFLSEFAGSFTLYREAPLVSTTDIIEPGDRLRWIVMERGSAKRIAEWGDVDAGSETYDFLDLARWTDRDRRASVAEGRTFIGDACDPRVLGLSLGTQAPRLVAAPNVSPPSGLELWLDVGDSGALEGVEYRVTGAVARRRADERWEEYCVYSAGVGLRWLVVADGHWSFVAPLEVSPGFDLDRHALEAMEPVVLEWATGELPWQATIGEVVMQLEKGPVAIERCVDEVSLSRATSLSADAIARAFGKRALPRPR